MHGTRTTPLLRIVPGAATLAFVALALVAAGCSDSDDPLSSGGRVTVQVHDQAAPAIEEAFVTFERVEVRSDSGAWIEADVPPGTEIDLLAHVGPDNAVTIASGLVPAGTYDALRVTVSAVRVTVDGTTTDLPVPAGGVTFSVPVPAFEVEEGVETMFVVDVPVDASFQIVGTDVVFSPSASLTSMSTR